VAATLAILAARPAAAAPAARVDGYAEWRRGGTLIVEGQRVLPSPGLRFQGGGEARDFPSIPLGYEVKARGTRAPDGSLVADEIVARPNGTALFEGDLKEAFDEVEERYRRSRHVYADNGRGGLGKDYGRLLDSGPEVERVQAILRDLVPPYRRSEEFRVYVVENPDWNAFAGPNGSIYVFTGLLENMDDDEMAVILGHELAHATYEHSRRAFKKQLAVQLGVLGGLALGDAIHNKAGRLAFKMGTVLMGNAWASGYGRDYEDQADRVGLRYAYEAGFDVNKGPALWQRFSRRYGTGNKVANFFFGDHALALARSANLERELALNYR
jgi:Zn-dependent protease with chaperone function